jgi:hypothetical protein
MRKAGRQEGGRARWILILASLLPPVVIGVLIARYAVNVPVIDSWFVFLARYLNDDLLRLDWGQFWMTQGGQHRKFVPQLLAAVVLKLTGFNLVALLYVNILIVFSNCLLFYKTYLQIAGSRRSLWVLAAISASFFSMGLWPWWIQPLAIEGNLAILGLVGAIFAVTRGANWRSLLSAAGFATLGAWSFFPGNIIWAIIPLLFYHYGFRSYRHYLAWLGLSSFSLLLNIWAFLTESNQASIGLIEIVFTQARELGTYLLAFLGSVMAPDHDVARAAVFGAVGLLVLIAAGSFNSFKVKNGFARSLPWSLSALWVAANGFLAALGRLDASRIIVTGATADRYKIYAALFWAALIPLLATAFRGAQARLDDFKRPNLTRGVIGAALAIFVLIQAQITAAKLRSDYLESSTALWRRAQNCVQTYLIAGKSCFLLPDSEIPRNGVARLHARGIYAGDGFDLPIRFVAPEGLMTAQDLFPDDSSRQLVYRQPNDSAVAWQLKLPSLDHDLYKYDPLEGIWLETGVQFSAPDLKGSDGFEFRIEIHTHGNLSESFSLNMESDPEHSGQTLAHLSWRMGNSITAACQANLAASSDASPDESPSPEFNATTRIFLPIVHGSRPLFCDALEDLETEQDINVYVLPPGRELSLVLNLSAYHGQVIEVHFAVESPAEGVEADHYWLPPLIMYNPTTDNLLDDSLAAWHAAYP